VKDAILGISICLLSALSGCATYQSPGEPADDPAQRAALLQAYRRPDTSKAVFRTVIRWTGRELSLIEVVKPAGPGGVSVVGMTDIGTTLYAAQIDPNGRGRIVTRNLPFSDEWLLENLVAELLIPWKGPSQACRLYRLPDKTRALVDEEEHSTGMFVFDEAGHWCQFRRLHGHRLLSKAFLEWDGKPVPKVVRIDNVDRHYHAVRERVEAE
jgi:hypothetical protein